MLDSILERLSFKTKPDKIPTQWIEPKENKYPYNLDLSSNSKPNKENIVKATQIIEDIIGPGYFNLEIYQFNKNDISKDQLLARNPLTELGRSVTVKGGGPENTTINIRTNNYDETKSFTIIHDHNTSLNIEKKEDKIIITITENGLENNRKMIITTKSPTLHV